MQEIKKIKKSINIKKHVLLIGGFLVPYVPMFTIFAVISHLLDTTYNVITIDILACIGLVFIFIKLLKLTHVLSSKIDKWLTDRYLNKDVDDFFVDEED